MFPGSQITELDRPSCLEDLIRRWRVLLPPFLCCFQIEGGGSNECWLNLGWEWVKRRGNKKKSKPHHSCVIQLPPRTFIPVGIYSYDGDEFNLWGNGRDRDDTRVVLPWRGDSTAREWVKILLLEVTRGAWAKGREQGPPVKMNTKQRQAYSSQGCRTARETVGRRRGRGCQCHFQLLILISSIQRLVKIMSDLCQILLQIKT